jgi:predicted amidohydrolase
LKKSEDYIRQSVSAGAEFVLLPEFFTSAIGFSEHMLDVAIQNRQALKWIKQWAAEYRVTIGGSYNSFDRENAFNLFSLVFPNGEIYEHRKDIPTQFENCYYTNGDEYNVLATPIGNIGVALCWEMIRYDTLKRISGKVDLCWPLLAGGICRLMRLLKERY